MQALVDHLIVDIGIWATVVSITVVVACSKKYDNKICLEDIHLLVCLSNEDRYLWVTQILMEISPAADILQLGYWSTWRAAWRL